MVVNNIFYIYIIMTRLKVFDSQTNSTYYLNNVDVSCAKLHSYIGETEKQ